MDFMYHSAFDFLSCLIQYPFGLLNLFGIDYIIHIYVLIISSHDPFPHLSSYAKTQSSRLNSRVRFFHCGRVI